LVFFHVTRPKFPLGQILSHVTCDVYSPKSFWNIDTRTVLIIINTLKVITSAIAHFADTVSVSNSIVSDVYYGLVAPRPAHNRHPKQLQTDTVPAKWAMECADVATFTFATWQMRSCFLCKLILPAGECLFSFPSIFELSSAFIKAISEILRKTNCIICKPSKEGVTAYKVCVLGKEITTILNIAADKDVAAFNFAVWQVLTLQVFYARRDSY